MNAPTPTASNDTSEIRIIAVELEEIQEVPDFTESDLVMETLCCWSWSAVVERKMSVARMSNVISPSLREDLAENANENTPSLATLSGPIPLSDINCHTSD